MSWHAHDAAAHNPVTWRWEARRRDLPRLFEALRQEIRYDHAESQSAQAPRLPEETGIM
jgi:hypothetical protein